MTEPSDRSDMEAGAKADSRRGPGRLETWPRPLRGIVPPLVTPLLDWDKLDIEGLGKLVSHVLEGGVHGLFILGTTGEGPSLSSRLRREVIQRASRLAAGRVPLMVGITDTSFAESVSLARYAAEHGAAAVVVAPPHYYPVSQPELLHYLEHLVGLLPLPAMLYNLPTHTKAAWEPAMVREAAQMTGVVGLKDSSGDLDYFRRLKRLLADRPDFSLLIGPEELLAEGLRAGAHGGVPGGANLFPTLYVRLHEAAGEGDWNTVRALHERVRAVSTALYGIGQYSSSVLKGLKCALACRGICSDFMAEPFQSFSGAQRRLIQKRVARLAREIDSSGVRAVEAATP